MAEFFRRRTAEVVCSLAAFLIGLLGIGWGLPNPNRLFPLHPDEAVNLLASRGVDPLHGGFVPSFYNYGTLYLDFMRLLSDLGEGLGVGPYLLPRFLNVLAFAACVGIAAALARKSFPRVAPWAAGFAVALAPGLSVHARFATVDVLATFFVAAAILAFAASFSPRRLFAGVALAAMAAACKYNCGLVVLGALPMILTAAKHGAEAEQRPSALRSPLMAGMLSLLTFVVLFVALVPGMLLDKTEFRRDVQYELLHTAQGHGLVFANTSNGFLFQLGNLATGYGLLPLLLSVAGLGYAAWRRERWTFVALLFLVPYYLLIGRAEVKFLRYVLPLIPALAAGFGVAVAAVGERLAQRREMWGRFGPALAGLALGLDPTGGLRGTATYALSMAGLDPRDAAGAYLRAERAPKVVGLATDPWFWSPSLYPESAAPRFYGPNRIFAWMRAATNPPVVRYIPADGAAHRTDFDLRLLTEAKPDYVALTTLEIGTAERLLAISGPVTPEAEAYRSTYRTFKTALERDYTNVQNFGELRWPTIEDMEYVRPSVYLYKRKSP